MIFEFLRYQRIHIISLWPLPVTVFKYKQSISSLSWTSFIINLSNTLHSYMAFAYFKQLFSK
jgi:hypothetical protein